MYRRFLNNRDYLSIITEQALNQLTRGDETRFEQAEQAAEASILDFLTENYEIEKELDKGKYLFEYNRMITYPVGSHFYFNGVICEVIQSISGYKAPMDGVCWEEYEEPVNINAIQPYSQMLNYYPGDIVRFNQTVYKCVQKNGFDFNDVRVPGVSAWQEVTVQDWEAIEYKQWDVVKYNGDYFTLMNMDGFDMIADPMSSSCWGMIGEYDSTLNNYELSEHEYVVCNGKVYYPIINPNAEEPLNNVNIKPNDPRNYNLKRHMVQLALYELHKLISPNNVSSVRVDDYEHSMQWLKNANRLRINPQIPRKVNTRGEEVMDWQLATFQTKYDPYENMWHI